MWGICLDNNSIQEGLFLKVIQYTMNENGNVIITSPKTTFIPDREHIRALPAPPKYLYGEKVSPCNHPDVIGIICNIGWHFKLNCYIYKIKVNEKVKSKRYYDDDLNITIKRSAKT